MCQVYQCKLLAASMTESVRYYRQILEERSIYT